MLGWPILTVIVFLPLGGALLTALLPSEGSSVWAPRVGLATALAELGLVAYLVVEFQSGVAGFQFVSHDPWISSFGISWNVGIDGISLFLVAMTALLFPVAMAGPPLRGDAKSFMGWMLVLEAACIGTFLSLDLFLFFVCFEITLVPAYFLVAGFGGFRRNYAAMKFFIYTFAGSAFMFVGILSAVFLVASRAGAPASFSLITLARYTTSLPHDDQILLFCAFAVGFAVKIPLVPFHSWLPDAYTEASTSGSMILAGILFKLGAYGLLRLGVFLFPWAAVELAPLLLTLAAVGITYGALVTIMQRDLKRLIAYSSIVDVAFIALGFFAFSSQGVTGGVFEMVNHGLTTGAMFFLVGMVWERRGTLRFADLGGLQRSAPMLAAIFLAVVLSAVGLPGLNGFVGEFLVLAGTFITHRWWAVVGTSAIVTGAIYLFWAYQRVFHGTPTPVNAAVRDISWREMFAIAPLLAGIVFLGVYPRPFLDRVTPSVSYLLQTVQARDPQAHVHQGTTVTYTVPPAQSVAGATATAAGSGSGSRDAAAASGGGAGKP